MWLQGTCSSDDSGCADQVLGHIHLLDETMELEVGQSFCKAVSNHLFRWDVGQLDSLGCNLIADVMVLDVDVLGPRMEDWVVCQRYRPLIVTFQRNVDVTDFVTDSRLAPPPTRNDRVLLDSLRAGVSFRDLD